MGDSGNFSPRQLVVGGMWAAEAQLKPGETDVSAQNWARAGCATTDTNCQDLRGGAQAYLAGAVDRVAANANVIGGTSNPVLQNGVNAPPPLQGQPAKIYRPGANGTLVEVKPETQAKVEPQPIPAPLTAKPAPQAKPAAAPPPAVAKTPVDAKTAAAVKLEDTEWAKSVGQFKGPPSKDPTSYGSSGDPVGSLQAGLIQAGKLDGSSRFQKQDQKYGNAVQTGFNSIRDTLAQATGNKDVGGADGVPDQKFLASLQDYQKLIAKDPSKSNDTLNQFIAGAAAYKPTGNAMTEAAARPGNGKSDKVQMMGDTTVPQKKTEAQPQAVTEPKGPKAENQPLAAQNNGLPQGVDANDWFKVGSSLTGASQQIVQNMTEESGAGAISNEGKMAIVLALKQNPQTASNLLKMMATPGFSTGGGASQVAAVKLFTSSAFMNDPNETTIKKEGRIDALRGVMSAQTPAQVQMMVDLAGSPGFANVSGGSYEESGIRDAYVKGASKAVVANLQDVPANAQMPWSAYKSSVANIGDPAVRAMAMSRIQDDHKGSPNEGAASQVYDTTQVSGFSSADARVQLAMVAGAGKSTHLFTSLGAGPLDENQSKILNSPKFAALPPGDQAALAAAVAQNKGNDLKLNNVLLPALTVMSARSYQRLDYEGKTKAFQTLAYSADAQAVTDFSLKLQGGLPADYTAPTYDQMGATSTAQVQQQAEEAKLQKHAPKV